MKPLPIALLALVLALPGCSNTETGISPQEKRNNFDACLIQYHKQNQTSQGISSYRDQLADEACAYLLEELALKSSRKRLQKLQLTIYLLYMTK